MEPHISLTESQISLMDTTDAETVNAFRSELETSHLIHEKQLQGDDMMLLRFLRARKMDIAKAKLMWTEMLQWRKETTQALAIGAKGKSESLLGHPDTALAVKSAYKRGFHGVDRGGRPIYIELLGQSDPQKLLSVITLEQYLDYRAADAEYSRTVRFPAAALHSGKHVDSQLVVLDVGGVGLKNFTATALQLLRAIQRIHGEFYPETLHKLFIINASPAFRMIWATVKTFLHPLTVSRVRILGAEYGRSLAEAADPAQLPKFLGGSCAACGGDCINSDFGPWRDERILWALDRLRFSAAAEEDEAPLPVAVAELCRNPGKLQELKNSAIAEYKKPQFKKSSKTVKLENHEILPENYNSSNAVKLENSNLLQANNSLILQKKPSQCGAIKELQQQQLINISAHSISQQKLQNRQQPSCIVPNLHYYSSGNRESLTDMMKSVNNSASPILQDDTSLQSYQSTVNSQVAVYRSTGSPPESRPLRLLLWLSTLAFMLATWLHNSALRLRSPDPLPINDDDGDDVDVSSSAPGNSGANCGDGDGDGCCGRDEGDDGEVDCARFYSKAMDLNLRISAMEAEHAHLKQILKLILYTQDELLHDLRSAFPSPPVKS